MNSVRHIENCSSPYLGLRRAAAFVSSSKKSVIFAPSKTVDELPVCRYLWLILIDVYTISLPLHQIPLTLFFYFLYVERDVLNLKPPSYGTIYLKISKK